MLDVAEGRIKLTVVSCTGDTWCDERARFHCMNELDRGCIPRILLLFSGNWQFLTVVEHRQRAWLCAITVMERDVWGPIHYPAGVWEDRPASDDAVRHPCQPD